MGRKTRKGRSVRRNKNINSEPEQVVNAPHSFVIHKGLPGGHTLELTKDFRRVMEPFTATSLKVSRFLISILTHFKKTDFILGEKTQLIEGLCLSGRAFTCDPFSYIFAYRAWNVPKIDAFTQRTYTNI